jgi:hypothetical protein
MSTQTLPQLTDNNPDMIKYAETDRRNLLDQLDARLTESAGAAPADLVADMIALYREVALRHTDAGWWLNNNSRDIAPIVQREMTADDKARLTALTARR